MLEMTGTRRIIRVEFGGVGGFCLGGVGGWSSRKSDASWPIANWLGQAKASVISNMHPCGTEIPRFVLASSLRTKKSAFK
jgi:hypothetical protein